MLPQLEIYGEPISQNLNESNPRLSFILPLGPPPLGTNKLACIELYHIATIHK